MPHARVVLLLLTVTTTAVAQAPPSQRPLTVDDLFALKQVGNPQVSPDGRWVAYVVRTLNLKTDRSEATLWMAPLDSGTAGGPIPLTAFKLTGIAVGVASVYGLLCYALGDTAGAAAGTFAAVALYGLLYWLLMRLDLKDTAICVIITWILVTAANYIAYKIEGASKDSWV